MFEGRGWRAIAFCCIVLSGCGGGGGSPSSGGGPTGPVDTGLGTFGAFFSVPSADAVGIEGTTQSVPLFASLTYTGTADLFLIVEYDPAVVLDVQGQLSGSTLGMTITLRGDLAAGSYPSELVLHACTDETCAQEPSGSPVSLPIHYTVTQNLQVQPQVTLSRSGSEPAPSASLPVTIPAQAGSIGLQVSYSRADALSVSFDGSQLQVQTQQVQAGTYTATATLQSTTDSRYSRTVAITYTVLAPAGGEQVLSAGEPVRTIAMQQGSQTTQHIVVTRPTWTDAWDPPVLDDPSGIATLTDLGNDHYDVTIDATGLAAGDYTVDVRFSAGPTGGTAVVRFAIQVAGIFYVDGDLIHALTVASTASDLSWSNAVLTFDGSAANWTAVSMSPALRVLRAIGQTGVDTLQLSLDPSALTASDLGLALFVQVSVDRPGSAPVTVQYSVSNWIPTLQRLSPATLVGTSGRIYVEGSFQQLAGNLLSAHRLQVGGATLANAQIVSDTRFVGDVSVLAVDVTGALPGLPITIGVDSALLPTQLQVQVQAPLRAAAGFQALPFASYRPAQFAPGLSALYFSAPGIAYRWVYNGGTWSLSQSSIAGLIDVAPSPDDTTLFATDTNDVIALDPATLARRSIGTLQLPVTTEDFDTRAMPGTRGLAFSADGRALASISDRQFAVSNGVGWVCTPQVDRLVPALTTAPQPCDPGIQEGPNPAPFGFGLVRSANGSFVEGVGPHGERTIYRAALRSWTGAPALAAGLTLAAVSDSGSRVVRGDGMLLDGSDNPLGNLASVVPFTHVPGGYGISSGGRFGFVYGYRLASTTPQTATDPTLWVVDLNDVATAGIGAAPVIAAIALPQAVGCAAALATGETCQHTASIGVAPGDGTAFVLGPRGVAAVPLPAAVSSAAPQSSMLNRAKTASQAHKKMKAPMRGILVPAAGSR